MSPKLLLQSLLPPLLWNGLKAIKTRLWRHDDRFYLAADGWATPLPPGVSNDDYWMTFMPQERAACERIMRRYHAGELVFTLELGEHLKHVTFAHALAIAAGHRPSLSVLDYGGNLGEYYWVGRALAPDVALEYHCKELPAVARTGRAINPEVTWYTDDTCFDRHYDLVMFSSSLQYLPKWPEVLLAAAQASRRYLYLSDIPTVRQVPAYVTVQRSRGAFTLYQPLNRAELVDTVEQAGLRLVREFAMGPHPHVERAPEQPVVAGWLFERPAKRE